MSTVELQKRTIVNIQEKANFIWRITNDKSAERACEVQLIDASKCCVKRSKPLGNKCDEFNDTCIALITSVYNAFTDSIYTDGDLTVESKVKDIEEFKFRKVAMEWKGETKTQKDTEIIPWKEDVPTYMEKNVLSINPQAKVNEKAAKIGYEIPFTREFYKYVPLEAEGNKLMNKILGKLCGDVARHVCDSVKKSIFAGEKRRKQYG